MIQISKKDILWGYAGQFFNLGAGLFTLPFILSKLSPEEIGLNYLILTIGSMISLFDFGFSSQFSRNFTYVFSGVNDLKREGLALSDKKQHVDYDLLSNLIATAKFVYLRISILAFLVMITFGTYYIYIVTRGFTSIENSLLIWVIYTFSIFFNLYFSYYNSLLIGKGLIMESKKAMIYSRVANILLTVLLIYAGFGLLSVVIANLISSLLIRILSYKYFFNDQVLYQIRSKAVNKSETNRLFEIIWHNSKKLGIVFISAYLITKVSLFLAGLYLPLDQIGSYGLMLQIGGILSGMSTTLFNSYLPMFSSLRIKSDKIELIKNFSFSMLIFYFVFLVGGLFIVVLSPFFLSIIKSNAELPSVEIFSFYLLILFLECNHSNFASLIITSNNIPFVKPALFAGLIIVLGSLFVLQFTNLGLLGLLLVQGGSQVIYNNWKWPLVIFKEFEISVFQFLNIGWDQVFRRVKVALTS